MIDRENVEKMENSRDKQIMLILAEKDKPYMKNYNGYAVRMEEEKQITYTKYDNRELTLTIPEGSYLMVGEDSSCPHIVTEKEWNDSNKFVEDDTKPSYNKINNKKIGLESI